MGRWLLRAATALVLAFLYIPIAVLVALLLVACAASHELLERLQVTA